MTTEDKQSDWSTVNLVEIVRDGLKYPTTENRGFATDALARLEAQAEAREKRIGRMSITIAELEGEVASAREIQETTEQAMVAQSQSWQNRVGRMSITIAELEGENARLRGALTAFVEEHDEYCEEDKCGDAITNRARVMLDWKIPPAEHPGDLMPGLSQSKEDLP